MIKLLKLLIILLTPLSAQIQVINSGDNGAVSLTKINSNFSFLNTTKTTTVFGSGAPGVVAGTGQGSIYMDTVGLQGYQCFRLAGCTAVGSGNWQVLGSGSSTGTVTSVGLSLPGIFTVTGSPITTSGTLTATLASQTQNRFWGSPNGSSGTPSFRAIVAADLPSIPFSGLTISAANIVSLFTSCSGTQYLGADGACHSPSGSGTVTSVALTTPSWLTVTGSPVTTSGTLAVAPTTGESSHYVIGTCNAATTFAPCQLVAGDLPSIPFLGLTISAANIVSLFSTCSGTQYLGADGACHNGNTTSSGTVGTVQTSDGSGGFTGTTPPAQLTYLRVQPNTGNSYTTQFSASPVYYALDYNFPAQSPSGTLTGGTPATVALTPCPLGVNGTDATHYFRIATTGTAESVLVTGGTCTSGLSTGNVTFTPGGNHSSGYTLASATNGIQEAVQVAKTAGNPAQIYVQGTVTLTGPVTITSSNITISGGVWNCNMDASTTFGCLNVIGVGPSTQTTSTTALTLANRSLVATKTIGVASAAGFTANSLVNLLYDDSTYHFEENLPIAGVSGSNITFEDPIVIPLLTAETNNVTLVSMITNVTVQDIEINCSGTSASVTTIRGLFAQFVADSLLSNLKFINCYQGSTATGLYLTSGYNNHIRDIVAANSGSANVNSILIDRQTMPTGDNLVSLSNPNVATSGFGVGIGYTVLGNFNNITASGNYSREFKIAGVGWSQFSNIIANNSVHATGVSITLASYRNLFTNVTALNNQSDASNGQGLWFSGQDNEYNTFYNVQLRGNGTSDFSFGSTDAHNNLYGLAAGTYPSGDAAPHAESDSGTQNLLYTAGGMASIQSWGCSGTAASSTTIVLTPATNAACTNAGSTTQQVAFITPVAGIIRNLRVSAGTAGVNSSSGVVTVTIPGSGSTGITCTLGTASSCTDLTDYYAYSAGTLFQINVTTQGSETLGDLLVSVGVF